ncbi:hypothetical protein GCM10027074_71120 [Streptomyces deserti]
MQKNAYLCHGAIVHVADVPGYSVNYRFHVADPVRIENVSGSPWSTATATTSSATGPPSRTGMRGERRIAAVGEVSAGRPVELGEVGRAGELTVRLGPGGRLRLLTSAAGTEYLDIRHDPVTGELVVNRDHA